MVEGDGWMEGEGKNGGALADNYALRLNNSISSFIFRLIFLQLFFFRYILFKLKFTWILQIKPIIPDFLFVLYLELYWIFLQVQVFG